MIGSSDVALALVAFLAAGTVKGLVGIGLPTTAIGLMALWLGPRDAVALTILPMLLTNAWQVWRQGQTLAALLRYLPFASSLMAMIWVTVLVSAAAPERLLLAVLGVAIIAFVAVQSTPWAPRIPDRLDRPAQIVAGMVAGILGGLTAVWGPPMVIYLAARRAGREEFVRATGVLITLGSLPLLAGYLRLGLLDAPRAATSLLLLVPAMAGYALGERLRGRLSERAFRRALLGVFLLMGLNLLRRALM